MENIDTVETPALLLDLDKLEKNITTIVDLAKNYGVTYRPHIKTHKSVDIAKMQMEAGAIGLTVAKVGEAEVMVEAGIHDILIAYPIFATSKLERIEKLRDRAQITVAVDSMEQADKLHAFFADKTPLDVWIKVNSGLNRCGVDSKEEVLDLAKYLTGLSGLRLTGLFTHAGHAYGAGSMEQIKAIADEEVRSIVESADLCEENGIDITHRSVGATPTFQYYSNTEGITEIRPGNAVFYDMVQVGLGVAEEKDCALAIQASVVGNHVGRIVIDAGSKTLALDKGAHGNDSIAGHGRIKEHPDLIIDRLSEEHGVISSRSMDHVKLGERLTIIPNHACPVANLFDEYVVHQNGKIVARWPVSARGRVD
jgi:D-serine deaminase-like pyridoxal phosphate-dependent protein